MRSWLGPYILLASMALSSMLIMHEQGLYDPADLLDRAKQVHEAVDPGEPFSFYQLGFRVAPMYPFGVSDGMFWNYHFDYLWLLQSIYSYQKNNAVISPEGFYKLNKAKEFLRETVAADLERNRPSILLIQREPINIINFFSESPHFVEVFRHYDFYEKFIDSSSMKETYIFVRTP